MTKVLITMPDELLRRVDREARARGFTRSRFIEEAARRELAQPSGEGIEAAIRRGREALAGLGSFESSELIRADRDRRDAAG